MDTDTVDRQFNALQQQAQQTGSLIAALAGKLSTAAAAGDPNAREWGLDLKEIALAIRDEQSTTTELLQAIHALIDNHVAAAAPPSPLPAYYPAPAEYSQPPQYQPSYPQPSQGGGALQRFLGGRFGQAIVTGAGIGMGDDIVNSILAQSVTYAQRSGWNRSKSGDAVAASFNRGKSCGIGPDKPSVTPRDDSRRPV